MKIPAVERLLREKLYKERESLVFWYNSLKSNDSDTVRQANGNISACEDRIKQLEFTLHKLVPLEYSFPLKEYKHEFPKFNEPGSFGAVRKYDIHTGVDLYCEKLTPVYAMEDGKIINVFPFTGEAVGSPWWNDTQAIMVEGPSGVILYGELIQTNELVHQLTEHMSEAIEKGQLLGHVIPVLKEDKGVVPSTSMLHMELYKKGTKEAVTWNLGEPKPDNLLDITKLLRNCIWDIK